jgi:hypothetical protein
MQYSKPFYDTNIKGFETELRKITNNRPQFAKMSSQSSSVSSIQSNQQQNIITTITKSPIKHLSGAGTDMSQHSQNLTKEELKINRRLNLDNRGNRQRFVHYIPTNLKK